MDTIHTDNILKTNGPYTTIAAVLRSIISASYQPNSIMIYIYIKQKAELNPEQIPKTISMLYIRYDEY